MAKDRMSAKRHLAQRTFKVSNAKIVMASLLSGCAILGCSLYFLLRPKSGHYQVFSEMKLGSSMIVLAERETDSLSKNVVTLHHLGKGEPPSSGNQLTWISADPSEVSIVRADEANLTIVLRPPRSELPSAIRVPDAKLTITFENAQ
jgi:hypothetical protein